MPLLGLAGAGSDIESVIELSKEGSEFADSGIVLSNELNNLNIFGTKLSWPSLAVAESFLSSWQHGLI